jgi:long-chain acyl-CoA synthetase
MLKDAGPTLVAAGDEALADRLVAAGVTAPVALLAELVVGGSVDGPPVPRAPDGPVTIIYTSGTSGEAKGVVLTRANVDFMLPVTRDHLDRMMGPREGDDRVFHYLPFCFAGSRIVLWTCLFRSNGVHVSTNLDDLPTEIAAVRPHYFLNVPILLERIRNKVEAGLSARPAPLRALFARGRDAFAKIEDGTASGRDRLWYALAKRVLFDAIKKRVGPDLRCLICGSAPLGADTQRFFGMLGIPVYQVYGLTETTAIVTMDRPPEPNRPGFVGYTIPGVETRVTDDGELLVRGPNIFGSYWNKPEVTSTAFVDGWFRTGDQVAQDPRGAWQIVGRTKNLLVPTSGHNVAPEPIEQRLVEAITGVENAVVVGHGKPHLTAILTGAPDPTAVQVGIDRVNADLPHYRRIRAFHLTKEPFTIESGLLTATSKLKRDAIEKRFHAEIEAMYA